MSSKSDQILDALRNWGCPCPGRIARRPGREHDDLAVNNKTFAYLPTKGQPFSLSVKLPYTGHAALQLPFAQPTGYGLGKSGWVSFAPGEDEIPSIEQLKEWVEESYRAQAPRRLVRELDARG